MRATDAPDTNVSWVIRRFSSIVQRRRVLTSPNACFEVSTYPSWTLTLVSTKGIFPTYRRFVETATNRRLPYFLRVPIWKVLWRGDPAPLAWCVAKPSILRLVLQVSVNAVY